MDLLQTHNFIPTITFPTRFTDISCTLIDNIFFKGNNQNNLSSGIIFTDISDHQPSSYGDPDLNYEIFESCITATLDKVIPIKRLKLHKYKHKKSSWITLGIIRSIKYKDKLYRTLKTLSSNHPMYNVKKNNLRVYKGILNKCIRKAKKNYFHTKLHKYKSDVTQTWNILKDIINRQEITNAFELEKGGERITNLEIVVEEFNKYFGSVGPNLAEQLKQSRTDFKSFLKTKISKKFTFRNINSDDIYKIISELKPLNSAGYDNISNKLLKALSPIILKPLTLIINQSLNTGIFPQKLKLAKVLPIFKKGSKSAIENYRPISLLPSISKIFEKVVYNQLYEYLEQNNLLYSNQYGFKKKFSTEHAILHLVDKIISDMDNFRTPLAIYLDLSKAFDTLDFDILLHKLNHFGISGNALTWFKSYLYNRKHFVQIENTKSHTIQITTGVPQGSILGPLLFII